MDQMIDDLVRNWLTGDMVATQTIVIELNDGKRQVRAFHHTFIVEQPAVAV